MTETTGQEGLDLQRTADGGPDGNPNSTPQTTTSETLLAQAMLDETQELAPLPPRDGAADDFLLQDPLVTDGEAPLETAAGPGAARGGGGSRYDSDFGQVIGGLQASGTLAGTDPTVPSLAVADDPTIVLTPTAALATPGAEFGGSDDDTGSGGNDTGSGGDDTGSGGGDDTGSGGDDTGSGGGDDTGSGGGDDTGGGGGDDPAGPGADQALFTQHPDTVDFNDIDAGGYLDGTQYDALAGDDVVVLPRDAGEALEAGFVPGTLFLAGNGNDQITGGDLDDAIDGGNSHDLLVGGGGNDTLLGGNGLDTLYGGDGNDSLSGGGDNSKDWLDGGAGNDTISAGNGNDTLSGGPGDDSLTGGHGRDDYSYSLTANEGNDTITDFESGKGGDNLVIADVADVNGDGQVDIGDLDAGGNSVSGTADGIVITLDSGTSITLDGLDGSGVDSFADLVDQAKVNVDIL